MGKILRSITKTGSAVCFAIDSTDIVATAHELHKTSPTMTAALGRVLTAASLMGVALKNRDDSLTLRFCGDGPCGTIIVTSDYEGNVRGYATNPFVDLPPKSNGHLDVSGVIGKEGYLYVVKDLGLGEPYSGTVKLRSGEVAEDIAEYFAASEQIPTVCALGVLVGKDYSVINAGGVLIQLLPMADDETIEILERNASAAKSVTEMLSQGMTAKDITDVFLAGLDYEVLDETEALYRCKCSRTFVEKTLVSLGVNELQSMAESGENTEISCHFCGKAYTFTPSEIKKILSSALKK